MHTHVHTQTLYRPAGSLKYAIQDNSSGGWRERVPMSALAAFPGDLGLISSTHKKVKNWLIPVPKVWLL